MNTTKNGWICPTCNDSLSPYVERCNCESKVNINANKHVIADEINRTKAIIKLKGIYEGLSSIYNPKSRSRIQIKIGKEMNQVLNRLKNLERK